MTRLEPNCPDGPDLFGGQSPVHVDPSRHRVQPYPAPPGSGPVGKTCKTCLRHITTGGYSRDYHKCKLTMTSSAATDIRVSSPACEHYVEMPRVYSRRKGAETPPDGAVYVGRPTVYGNPFPAKERTKVAHEQAIAQYVAWIYSSAQNELRAKIRTDLRCKDLVCWCHPLPCHAEVLLEIANS